MTIVRYSPVADFYNRWHQDVDHWLAHADKSSWQPAVDIQESETAYTLIADVPGIAFDAIDITLEDSTLTIAGERNSPSAEDGQHVCRSERRQGAFQRQFVLPDTADVDAIEANGNQGVLTVVIPKRAQLQPRKITVTH